MPALHVCTGELGALTFDEHTRAADELRGRICAELSKRRDDVAPFIDEDFDSYLARMAQPRTWGGECDCSLAGWAGACKSAALCDGWLVWVWANRAASGEKGASM